MIDKKKLKNLIIELKHDLPKLKSDESYFSHDPMYFNFAAYYDSLCEKIETLGVPDEPNLFSMYIVSLLAYQMVENEKELWELAEILIKEFEEKLALLELGSIDKEVAEDLDDTKYQA